MKYTHTAKPTFELNKESFIALKEKFGYKIYPAIITYEK